MIKLAAEELAKLLGVFKEQIEPWCRENNFSLHQAFEISREQDKEKYRVLNKLWYTKTGRNFLRSAFKDGSLSQNNGK